jgi:hypothetical protein
LASGADDENEAMHQSLRELRTIYESAIETGDFAPLKGLFTPETTAVMVLGQEISSFEELEGHWAYIRELIGEGGSYRTSLNPERSLIIGGVAVSHGTSDEVVTTGSGTEFKFNTKWTAVSHLVDGKWQVVRLHASMNPVGNVFTAAFMKKAKTTYGIGGLVIGAVLAFVVLKIGGKRSDPA